MNIIFLKNLLVYWLLNTRGDSSVLSQYFYILKTYRNDDAKGFQVSTQIE
jgi:hypothetical protein